VNRRTTANGGLPATCTATGPVARVEIPFDFPGPSPIVGTLPRRLRRRAVALSCWRDRRTSAPAPGAARG
jgi:hypothetical protein